MAYKDKEKAREAARARQRKHRAQGVTKGVTNEGVTQGVTGLSEQHGVCKYCGAKIDKLLVCCGPCAWSRSPNNANSLRFTEGAYEYTGTMTDYEREYYKPASELGQGEYNPVSKPGDEHYVGSLSLAKRREHLLALQNTLRR